MERTRRDFGEVFIGEELSQVFTVRNVGTAPLELANKTLAAQSQASRAVELITAKWQRAYNAAGNYLRPAAATRRLAAPT
jgi:hypothetical protein